jgi:hypothetical protein
MSLPVSLLEIMMIPGTIKEKNINALYVDYYIVNKARL